MALLKVSKDIMMPADSENYVVLVVLKQSFTFNIVDHKILINRLQNQIEFSGSVIK